MLCEIQSVPWTESRWLTTQSQSSVSLLISQWVNRLRNVSQMTHANQSVSHLTLQGKKLNCHPFDSPREKLKCRSPGCNKLLRRNNMRKWDSFGENYACKPTLGSIDGVLYSDNIYGLTITTVPSMMLCRYIAMLHGDSSITAKEFESVMQGAIIIGCWNISTEMYTCCLTWFHPSFDISSYS